MAAQRTAHAVFRTAISAQRAALRSALGSARLRSERRAARAAYGEAVLPAKISRDEALARAHTEYVATVESARVDYLVEVGANHSSITSATYEHAIHVATSHYRAQVAAARRNLKSNANEARRQLASALDGAQDHSKRESAQRAFDNAHVDASNVFRVQVTSARNAFQSKVALAKAGLRASMSAVPG